MSVEFRKPGEELFPGGEEGSQGDEKRTWAL